MLYYMSSWNESRGDALPKGSRIQALSGSSCTGVLDGIDLAVIQKQRHRRHGQIAKLYASLPTSKSTSTPK